MLTTSQSVVISSSLLVGIAVATSLWWCWRKKQAGKGGSDEPNEEKTPLIIHSSKKKQVLKTIAKFESQEASNNERREVAPTVGKVARVERCPACRKALSGFTSSQEQLIWFQGQKIHPKCFACCDCQQSLDVGDTGIQRLSANVRVKFQCQDCFEKKSIQTSRKAGARVQIEDHEQGDTKQTLEVIGDDLNEAVYFMHPKCCVCGGNFSAAKPMAEHRGNWRYHTDCWQGKETPETTIVKLSPAHSAKYLPGQIVLQLASTNGIVTTLYFVWKDRINQAETLRKESSSSPMVTVPYCLDPQAPANPNYVYQPAPELYSEGMQHHKQKKQRRQQQQQQTQKILALPDDQDDFLQACQLKLLAAEQVAPLTPQMPQNATVCTETNTLGAKLTFVKFGLWYGLCLTIPIVGTTTAGSNQLNLEGANLSVTIRE